MSTKAGYDMWEGPYGNWGSRKYLLSSLDQSLKRLGLEYVDIFYSHRHDPETPLEETMGALAHAVRSGKALYVGISNYDAAQTERAAKLLRDMGTPCLIHQPKYNMFDRGPERGLLDVLVREGIGGIAFCPLAQGMLDRPLPPRDIPADSRASARPRASSSPENITDDKASADPRAGKAIATGSGTVRRPGCPWEPGSWRWHQRSALRPGSAQARRPRIDENYGSAQGNLAFGGRRAEGDRGRAQH